MAGSANNRNGRNGRNGKRVGSLKPGQKWAVYSLSVGLLLSGIVWLYFFYFVRVVDQFGFENPHPAQRYFLIGHAVVALPAVWLFGILWNLHVKPGWKARTRRWSGGTSWTLVLWMILTGYSLYYIGSEAVRDWIGVSHWVAGLAGTAFIVVHIRRAATGNNGRRVAVDR